MLVSIMPSRIPKAERPTGKVCVIDDGVEAVRRAAARGTKPVGAIARSKEERSVIANPILGDRQLERSHLRVDVDRPAGNRIEGIVAERLVKRIADIDALDVAVSGPAQIVGANAVLDDIPVNDVADWRRPDQEAVIVVVQTGIVAVVVEAEFGGVALGQEILNIKIGDVYLLMALVEGIQPTVGVLLEEIEICEVVVQAVGAQIAEKPDARLLLGEEKTAEVAGELLNPGADRDKVEVRAQVVDLRLDKRFLNSGVSRRSDRYLLRDRH